MREVREFCDRCKKQIFSNDWLTRIYWNVTSEVSDQRELCKSCFEELKINFMRNIKEGSV